MIDRLDSKRNLVTQQKQGVCSPTKSTKAGSTSNPGTLSQILQSQGRFGNRKGSSINIAPLQHKSSGIFALSAQGSALGSIPGPEGSPKLTQSLLTNLRASELAVNSKYEHLWRIASQTNPPMLSLRIKNGNSQSHNKMLQIDALGLQGDDNLRNTRDGHVYFGTLKHSLPDAKGNIEVLNDYVLPTTTAPTGHPLRDPKTVQQLLGDESCEQRQPRHRGR